MLCVQSFLVIIVGVYGIGEKLLFSSFNNLKEIDLDTGLVRTLYISQNEYVYSMAYDHKNRFMYVPRFTTGDIARFPYPNNQTLVLQSIVSATTPVDIVFDSVNSHLYWTETLASGKIMRCKPDGSDGTIIFNDISPAALTLDTHNRWIYYGQQIYPSQIFRINFDGTDKRVLVQNQETYVFGIGIDIDFKRLYWMEYNTGDLRSAWLNGSDVKTIISTNAKNSNWNIDMNDDFFFYTSSNKIMKINKSLGQNQTVVHTDTQQIYGLLFYKQKGRNISNTMKSNVVLHFNCTTML